MKSNEILFHPAQLGSLALNNRVAVAPMTRISATADGQVTEDMVRYYTRFAAGGYGLIITEGVYPDEAYSQGYLYQPGLANAAQTESWKRAVDAVHGAGGRIIIQLMHAGALSQGNHWTTGTIGPSAVPPLGEQLAFYRGEGAYPIPREIRPEEIVAVREGFVEAARRAQAVGFDGIEVHGANGYLLDQFLTDYSNARQDEYGGSTANRVRLTAEIVAAIKAAVGADYPVGVRISQGKVNDYHHKWKKGVEDAHVIFEALKAAGADFIHITEYDATAPAFGEGESLAALAKRFTGLPVIANGGLGDPETAILPLERGEADVIALGKSALANPDWPKRVQENQALHTFDYGVLQPLAHVKEFELGD